MMISTVRGQFGAVKGEVVYDPAKPEKSSVQATIDCTTVNTGEPKRDADLKSAEFFDVKQYPVMKFKSTGVDVVSAGKLKVNGTADHQRCFASGCSGYRGGLLLPSAIPKAVRRLA